MNIILNNHSKLKQKQLSNAQTQQMQQNQPNYQASLQSHSISVLINAIIKISHSKLLYHSFSQIKHFVSTIKNKELIYQAINKNTLKSNLRRKPNPHLSTVTKQKQESFINFNDDISTIILDKQERATIGKQSRIDLENLLDIKFDWNQEKLAFGNDGRKSRMVCKEYNQAIEIETPYFTTKKRSRTDKSVEYSTFNVKSTRKSFIEQTQFKKCSFTKVNDNQTLELSQTIKISRKKTKQTEKNSCHQIFVVRQPARKSSYSSSMPINVKVKYIEVPLKSNNVKIIESNKANVQKKALKNFLNTQTCLKSCLQNQKKLQNDEKCEFCPKVEKSKELLRKFRSTQL